ncbi:uncharacterized protein LOC143528396 [Brachyhypopomus gauderio]|uniref:uncharacterized protein LOC143528396 n=1 Tax=Brachyhypopomus gauderio TaxID=698409 RepID=UPI0040437643
MFLHTKKLFLYLFMVHMTLQVESNVSSVNKTVGKDAWINFTFESLNSSKIDYKSLVVRRDDKKIEGFKWTESPSNCTQFYINISSTNVYLYFPHLSKTHMGVYQLALYVENQQMVLIESNKVNLTVYSDTNTTAETPVSNDDSRKMTQSEIITKILIFSILVIMPVFVLSGMLGWFYWTSRKTDDTPAQSPSSQQRQCPMRSTVPAVSTIEYGVLNFHKQPDRPTLAEAPKVQEGVEYATILYPPQRKRT